MNAPSLTGATWNRLRSCPTPHRGGEPFDEVAALAAGAHDARFIQAYHLGAGIEVLVARSGPDGEVLWASAHDGLPGTGLSPSGSETEVVSRSELDELIGALVWGNLQIGLHDTRDPDDSWTADLEDLLLNSDHGSLAWYLQATPVRLATGPEVAELGRAVSQGSRGSTIDRLAGERAGRILELLQLSEPTGLWRATLWAGASSEHQARALIGQILASSGVRRLPVVLTGAARLSDLVPTCVLGSLGRHPAVEVPGVRMRRSPRWDMTPERDGPIRIGQVLAPTSLARGGPVSVTPETINRHVFVTGATGSGKSQTVRRILGQLTANGTPWLVIEPAKAEYHTLAETIPAPISLIRLGGDQETPLSLNPLEPTSLRMESGEVRTFNLATHIALVRGLFEASFEIQEPFPQILATALDRAYRAYGWSTLSGRRRGAGVARAVFPTLGELRRHALEVVEELGYGREVRDNVRGFVEVRINGLRNGAAGRFFESGHPIDFAAMAASNVILQIEDLGNERDQAFLMGSVLIRWIEFLRMRGDSGGRLRHVLVIEEAHRLLRAADDARAPAIEQFANMLAEVRSYGQGMIIAEQIPSKLIPDVIKNSALKVVHRLPAQDDRDTVGATMNLDDAQSAAVVALDPGHAVVHADGMDYPIPVVVDGPLRPVGRPRLEPMATFVRSAACSASCRAGSRCTGSQLETSSQLAEDPGFGAWVELATAARLLGEPLPTVAGGHVARWLRLAGDPERLRCALGVAADRSVRSRTVYVLDFYSPDDLALELAETLFALLTGEGNTAARPGFQTGELRWRDVFLALLEAAEQPNASEPHPATDSWKERGLDLVGGTVQAQLDELEAVQRANQTSLRGKLWGEPSVLEDYLRSAGLRSVTALADWLGMGGSRIVWWFERAEDAPAGGSEE